MPCGPCEERKKRLQQAADGGAPLPGKDWAFYAGWGLALALGGYVIWQRRRNGRSQIPG